METDKEVKKYCPSNASDGQIFMSKFCDRCELDSKFSEDVPEGGCQIIVATMVWSVNDPLYPAQWCYDANGQPTCTAFVPMGDDKTLDIFG